MHKLISNDNGVECYRCGAHFEDKATPSFVDCTGPLTEHPGYYLGDVDGVPYRETCAAHPYGDCEKGGEG